MTPEAAAKFEQCNCLAVRQAARHLTQFYDQYLAPSGLRTTQFSILAKLRGYGPLSINALAKELVMDRTTLGRNMLPLEREGLIEIVTGTADRRTKELRLTQAGVERLRVAAPGWDKAQSRFEQAFGRKRSSELRALLDDVVASEL
jgi:DNA-binding MarR family transcriptional regulator